VGFNPHLGVAEAEGLGPLLTKEPTMRVARQASREVSRKFADDTNA